jgi:CheY-like chemotaxis protein
MAVLLLTPDLLFSSRLSGIARQRDVSLVVAGSAEGAVGQVADSKFRCLIIDLDTPAISVAELVAECRRANQSLEIIAYGPHVHEEKLAAARAAGCDVVLTRGQFDSRMGDILSSGAKED